MTAHPRRKAIIETLEITLKKYVIELHKKIVGKGPDKVFIKIVKNMVIIKLEGCFTLIEKSINDADHVLLLRRKLGEQNGCCKLLADMLGAGVIDTLMGVYIVQDMMCCTLVLDRDLTLE